MGGCLASSNSAEKIPVERVLIINSVWVEQTGSGKARYSAPIMGNTDTSWTGARGSAADRADMPLALT